jgi:hypothetical protein
MFSASAVTIAVLSFILAVGAAYAAGCWLFKKDTEMENRRRAAGKLAAKLQEFGLSKIPEFLIDYSVGDYSGMATKIHNLAELFLGGEAHVLAEFDDVYQNVLAAHLKTDAGRALLAAKLQDAVKATDPSSVTNAPGAQVTQSTKS